MWLINTMVDAAELVYSLEKAEKELLSRGLSEEFQKLIVAANRDRNAQKNVFFNQNEIITPAFAFRLLDQFRQMLPKVKDDENAHAQYNIHTVCSFLIVSFTIAFQMDTLPSKEYNFHYYLHPTKEAVLRRSLNDFLQHHLTHAKLDFFSGDTLSKHAFNFIDGVYHNSDKNDQREIYRLMGSNNQPEWRPQLQRVAPKSKNKMTAWLIDFAVNCVNDTYHLTDKELDKVESIFRQKYTNMNNIALITVSTTYLFADHFSRRLDHDRELLETKTKKFNIADVKYKTKIKKMLGNINRQHFYNHVSDLFFTVMVVAIKIDNDHHVWLSNYNNLIRNNDISKYLEDEEDHLRILSWETLTGPERVREIFVSLNSTGQKEFIDNLEASCDHHASELVAFLPVEQSRYWMVNAVLKRITELYPIPLQEDCSQLPQLERMGKIRQELRQVKIALEGIVDHVVIVMEQLNKKNNIQHSGDMPFIRAKVTHNMMDQFYQRLTNPFYHRDEIVSLFYAALVVSINNSNDNYKILASNLASPFDELNFFQYLSKAIAEHSYLFASAKNLTHDEIIALYDALDEANQRRFSRSIEDDNADDANIVLLLTLSNHIDKLEKTKAAIRALPVPPAAASTTPEVIVAPRAPIAPPTVVARNSSVSLASTSSSTFYATTRKEKPFTTNEFDHIIVPRNPPAPTAEPAILRSIQAAESSPLLFNNEVRKIKPITPLNLNINNNNNNDDDNDTIFDLSP